MFIYKIENKIDGKFYIGKTSKTLEERFRKHLYNHLDGQTYLYKAMRKHGIENFDISLVEEVTEDLDLREKYWIAELNPTYNMTVGGDGGDTSSSPNFKFGIQQHHYTRTDYPGSRMLGKTHTSETKRKQSEKRTEHWNSLSDEERENRSKKITGQKNGMYGKLPKNSLQIMFNGVKYSSISEASQVTGHSGKYLKKHGEIYNEQCE
jgi:group I intron endonuclease